MERLTFYTENLVSDMPIDADNFCQEVCFVEGTNDKCLCSMLATYRTASGKLILFPDTRAKRIMDGIKIADELVRHCGFKPMEFIDKMTNFDGEDAEIFKIETNEYIFVVGNFISRRFDDKGKVIRHLYRKGFID